MDRDARLVRACNMVETLEKAGHKKSEILTLISKLWEVSIKSIMDELRLRHIYDQGDGNE